MKKRSQIAPSCFSGPTKLVDFSPPVAWLGILQVLHLILVIDHPAALALAVNFTSKDLEKGLIFRGKGLLTTNNELFEVC